MTSEQEVPRPYAVSLREARGRWFTAGAVATALLSLPTQILFERGLGVEGFAQWLLVNGLVTFFMPLATLGSVNLILSEFFEGHLRDERGRHALARYFAITTALAAVGFLVVYGWAPLAGRRTSLDVLLGVAVVIARSPVVLVYPIFQIHHKSILVALWPAIENLGRFLIALASVVVVMTFAQSLAWWLIVTAALAVVSILCIWMLQVPAPPAREREEGADVSGGAVASRGVRFGVVEYLDSLDLKLAIPVAALMLTTKEVAGAGLGLLLLNAAHFFPYAIVMRYLLPALHSRVGEDNAAVHAAIVRWMTAGSVLITVAGIGCAIIGADVIALVAQGDYSDQRFLFPIVGVTMIPLCISILASARFQRIEHAKHLMTWRIQATLAFLLVTIVSAASLGAAAPILGIFASRTYLLARFTFGT